jgi:hypothetical protein
MVGILPVVLLHVVPASPFVPHRLLSLGADAEQEGIRIISVVRNRWEDGSERYQGRGERILAAVAEDEVIGIGVLSQCPHREEDNALPEGGTCVVQYWR